MRINLIKATLTQCWKDVLFNQFHDILGGACIPQAYSDARKFVRKSDTNGTRTASYEFANGDGQYSNAGQKSGKSMEYRGMNLNGFEYDGYIEAEVQWAHEFEWYDGAIVLEDSNKVRYECKLFGKDP